MSRTGRTSDHTLYFFLSVLILAITIIYNPAVLSAQDFGNKKAVIFIVDNISLNELVDSNSPNFHRLMERGGIAQMNIRAKSSLSNRGSAYLSLALGVRTLASNKGGQAYDKDEIVFSNDTPPKNLRTAQQLYQQYTGNKRSIGQVLNLAIVDTEKSSLSVTSRKLDGLLGQKATELGLTIGLVGNSDTGTKKRESTMLAIDKLGQIPYGSVGSNLLKEDIDILGGVRLDERSLLQVVDKILPKVDILFIDYGDTVRVQDNYLLAMDRVRVDQKLKAIHRADAFLGSLISRIDLSNTLFMVISPNPSRESVQAGNFGLTPIIVADPNTKQGLLISNTTRRNGLVANFDFAPTIFKFFVQSDFGDYIGEPMEIIQHSNPVDKLLQDQSLYLVLRKYRSTFHWTYIVVTAITLVLLFLQLIYSDTGKLKGFSNLSLLLILAIPVTLLTVSLFGYGSIIFDLMYMLGGSLIIALIIKLVCKNLLLSIGILSLLTTILLLIDVFFIKQLMVNSPLGSDAIAGNRFYGMGNDSMGVLLGSTILGLFTLFEYFKVNRKVQTITTIFLFTFVILGLSPMFGANIGGTLTALTILLLALIMISNRNISFRGVLALIGVIIVVIFLLAIFDATLNPTPSHVGKALNSLILGGWGRFIEIIQVKMQQVIWNLIHAPWNTILFLEIILLVLLVRFKYNYITELKTNFTVLSKGFILNFFGAVAVFLFNDTGTIASALMSIYLVFPLAIAKEFY